MLTSPPVDAEYRASETHQQGGAAVTDSLVSMPAVALVTGAAQGMGAAVAARLAQDGFAIAAVDVKSCDTTLRALRVAGGLAKGYVCDVQDWAAVGLMCQTIEDQQGPIAAVASVAGVWEGVPFLELDPTTWSRVVDVNLTGSFNVCRHTAEHMAARKSGAIVCVASNAAYMAWLGGAHYSASKAGLVGLVRAMALELGPLGIRVNAIAPGTVRTPANEDDLADPEVGTAQARACPLGRVGTPDDIADAVSFLTDNKRASWVTGITMLVDGGFGTHGEGADFASASSTVPRLDTTSALTLLPGGAAGHRPAGPNQS